MAYHVYILKSNQGFNYIGQTSDLIDRIHRHNTNRSAATKNKGKWEIVSSYETATRSEAVRLEKKLKRMKKVEKAIKYLQKLNSEKREKGLEHPD